jgi:hypothetical protein
MSFKTKNKKKNVYDNRVTLQAKHNLKINYFNEKQNSLETIKEESELIQLEISEKYNKPNNQLTCEELESKMDLLDKLKENAKNDNDISSNSEEIDYLLDTGKILFNYADNTSKSKKKKINNFKEKILDKTVMDYFNPNIPPVINSNETVDFDSKEQMYENYLLLIDENFDNLNKDKEVNNDICKKCYVETVLYISDGKQICHSCGEETFILIDSDKPSYKEPPREVSYFAYKRINHFNEWLAQFQAKESTDIPQDVYNQIISELKKERIDDMKNITPNKLREILKKLKKNKYYEHVPHIINRLNGEPPPTISRETEEELRRMFKEIQVPFHKFCPKSRKNFLSYSYVLHKFVQLLELDEFIECFILLKSREKLHQQDQIWKQICEHLHWQFIASV